MASSSAPLPEELQTLLPPPLHALCEAARYGRGALLFETGRRPAAMFFVNRGEVTLQRHGRDGGIVTLQRSRHGFVGEASLQSDRYHCDAVVVADAEVTRIPLRALAEALRSDPDFALRWIGMLNREVRRLRLQCERLSLKGVRERVLHLLQTEGGAGRLAVSAGFKSLASELAVTHEALYRALAAMEREGIVAREPGWLVLRPRP